MVVKVVDAPPGVGKTSALINYMNANAGRKRFMFVTPFLKEAERIIASCPQLNFQTPAAEIGSENKHTLSKLIDMRRLIERRQNIVTTHALFRKLDSSLAEAIYEGEYTLVMDEVADVIQYFEQRRDDAIALSQTFVSVNEDGFVTWNDDVIEEDYSGKFADAKELTQSNSLWRINDRTYLIVLPIYLFQSFRDAYLLTYMFYDSIQRCYFDLFNISYEQRYVVGNSPLTYTLTTTPRMYPMPGMRQKIHICDDERLNHVGLKVAGTCPLSRGWYGRPQNKELVRKVGRNVTTYLRGRMGANWYETMWTSYKGREFINKHKESLEPLIKPNGFAKAFVPCNSRATNEFRNRSYLAYTVNRYLIPAVGIFLKQRGLELDADRWALSEMLQWIWRSAIRDGKEIWIYIPSERMRGLLEDWIREVDTAA